MAEIISKEEQPLLGRTLIQAKTSFEGTTPDRKKIRKEVAKAAGEKEEHIIIKAIRTGFGGGNAVVEVAVYKNMADATAVEHKSMMEKHKKEEPKEEKAEEAPAEKEQVADEQPAEKTAEETKKE